MNHDVENIKIECAETCGNAPKKQLLRDMMIAYVKNEMDVCLEPLADNVVWEIVGGMRVEGKGEVKKALCERQGDDIRELSIQNIITHGNSGAINGHIRLKDERSIAFCHVYNFSGFGKKAKIKQVTSYIIEN